MSAESNSKAEGFRDSPGCTNTSKTLAGNETSNPPCVEGQLNARERELLVRAIREATPHPRAALEVGTWLGGGSTLHILRALENNGQGHLWGIEADRSIYDRMV